MTVPQQMLQLAYALKTLDECEQAHAQAWYEATEAHEDLTRELAALRRCATAVNAGSDDAAQLIHQHGADFFAARETLQAARENLADAQRERAAAQREANAARAAVSALAARPLVEDCKPATRDASRALRLPVWSVGA